MKNRPDNNARELLLSLGMGQFNATIAIQYMFLAPAATDPAMPSVFLMTKHLQQGLRAAGANVAVTGQIDEPTADQLRKLVGPDWNQVTWYALFNAVVAAKRSRVLEDTSDKLDLSGLPSLPSVPGGGLTWLAAAAAAYYFLIYKKGR